MNDFNDTKCNYPHDKTIAELFDTTVTQSPDSIAVVDKGTPWTRKEIDQWSNQIALQLIARGIRSEERVAIMVDRNVETVVSMLAILKAGGAFVPIDFEYPTERIAWILSDCGARFLIKAHDQKCVDFDFDGEVLEVNKASMTTSPASYPAGIQTNQYSEQLCYVMYTSGSTGKPKGVMIEQRNVVRLVMNTNYVELNESTRWLQPDRWYLMLVH